MTHRIAGGLAALALVLPVPALAQAGMGRDLRAEIGKVTQAWETAYNAGDAAAVAALYAQDAKVLPPGQEAVSGRAAIQSFWADQIAEGGKSTLTLGDVMGGGDMAVEVSGYESTGADGTHLDHGKYIVIYKKVGGAWKIYRDIWNSSMSQ